MKNCTPLKFWAMAITFFTAVAMRCMGMIRDEMERE